MNLLLLIILLFLLTFQQDKYKFVFQIHRHGARAPVYNMIKNVKDNKTYIDIYNETWNFNGELTETGKRMHYLIGVYNRKKYINNSQLLSDIYNPNEILVKSTNVNRTIMSIYSQLQGFYPQNSSYEISNEIPDINLIYPQNFINDEQLLNKIKESYSEYLKTNSSLPNNITIIPVHNINEKLHNINLYSPDYCPGIKKYYEEGKNCEEIIQFKQNLPNDTKKKLKKINDTFLDNYQTLFSFMDTLIADLYDDRKLTILEDINIEELKKAAFEFLSIDYENVNYYYNETSIYSMSPMIREILFYMDDIINNNDDQKNKVKYLIFSGHDTNIAGFEIFNNKVFNTPVEYANFSQTEYYELFIKDFDQINEENITEDNYYVRYLRGDIQKFEIKYTDFKNTIQKYLWSDKKIKEFCKFEVDVYKIKSKTLKYVTIILSIIDLILIVYLIFIINEIIKKRKNKKTENDIEKLQPLNSFKKEDN